MNDHNTTTATPTEAVNPHLLAKLHNIPPSHYSVEKIVFGFRAMKKEDGTTGERRAPVTLEVPLPTINGIISALTEGHEDTALKVQEWVTSLVRDAVRSAVRQQISDEEKPVNTQTELDLDRISVAFIACLPIAERTGGGISKEVWESFGKDYSATMIEQGMEPSRVARAVDMLLSKFVKCKTNKGALQILSDYLDVYIVKTQQADDYADCFSFLKAKAKTLMEADDRSLVEAL